MSDLRQWLTSLGCKRRHGTDFILDEFDHEFYLRFDTNINKDNPDTTTCDIHVVRVDELCTEGICVVMDAKMHGVMRFLFALGVSRFSDKTKGVLYAMSNPLRNA